MTSAVTTARGASQTMAEKFSHNPVIVTKFASKKGKDQNMFQTNYLEINKVIDSFLSPLSNPANVPETPSKRRIANKSQQKQNELNRDIPSRARNRKLITLREDLGCAQQPVIAI